MVKKLVENSPVVFPGSSFDFWVMSLDGAIPSNFDLLIIVRTQRKSIWWVFNFSSDIIKLSENPRLLEEIEKKRGEIKEIEERMKVYYDNYR